MKLGTFHRGSGPHLTFLHGFTQTKESWIPVIDALPQRFAFDLIDAPGHGESSNGQRTLTESGDDVAESMSAGVLIGYSMGARIALHTALQHPEKVNALVLVSGTAGIDSDDERASRRSSDEALADRITEVGVSAFIEEWLSNPMFQGLARELADIPSRCSNTAKGLGDSLRFAGTGTQEPLWGNLQNINIPVLLIVGENDEKFTQIAHRMHSLLPQCELHVVKGVGHTCHLEDINVFTEILQRWLLGVQGNR